MPLVSVVIPTFERRALMCEAVASVLAQTFADFELIVVDDGSQDDTVGELAARFADSRLRVVRQENRGASAARNRGVAEARGEWLAFLDSDDTWLPPKLERQLQMLADHPEAPACYTGEIWYRDGRWANPRNVHTKYSGWIFPYCLPLCIISPSSILMKRALFETLGGFDETLPACEDYDLWLRLSARYSVQLLEERLIVKRNGHPGQLSRAHWGLDRFRVRALWKLARDVEIPWKLRRQALETAASKSGVVATGALKRGHRERYEVFLFSRKEALRWLESSTGEPLIPGT